jgi:hypothetical protein
MKRISIFLTVLLSVAAIAYGQSVTITLTAMNAMDSTTVIDAALSAAETTRGEVTEIKLASASADVYWSLKDCQVVSTYFRPKAAPALVKLDLSEAAFPNETTPGGSTGSFDGMGITDVILPPSVETIGGRTFIRCSKLANITWPLNLKRLDEAAFANCSSLAITTLPESITAIYGYVFQSCTKLALTALPPGLTGIIGSTLDKKATFSSTKVSISELPAGVTGLGQTTFSGCTEITSMTFPEGFTVGIGASAFANCTSLTKFIFKGSTPPATIDATAFGSGSTSVAGNIDVVVPQGSLSAYQAKLGSFGFKSITEVSPPTTLNLPGSPVEIKTVSVYTVTGNEVLKFKASGEQDYGFALDRLASGVYILKTDSKSLKVIKK